jgi:Plavaka transposase
VDFILHPVVDALVGEDGVRERLFSHPMNADLAVEAFSEVKDKVCSSPDPKVFWNAGLGPSQSIVGGVALYSDKSSMTASALSKYFYSLHVVWLNASAAYRHKLIACGSTVVAYLSTRLLDEGVGGKPRESQSVRQVMLHKCLSLALEPICSKMLCRLLATTRDGTSPKVHIVLGTYITDVPEGKDVSCIKHGNTTPMPCGGCEAAAGWLAESVAGQVQWRHSNGMERIRQESLCLLRDGSSVLQQRGQEELTKISLSTVAAFYRDWPFAGDREHRLLAASRYYGFESMHSLASGTLKTLLVAIGARLSNARLVSATMTTSRFTSRPLSSINTTALRHLNALLSSPQRENTMPGLRIDF